MKMKVAATETAADLAGRTHTMRRLKRDRYGLLWISGLPPSRLRSAQRLRKLGDVDRDPADGAVSIEGALFDRMPCAGKALCTGSTLAFVKTVYFLRKPEQSYDRLVLQFCDPHGEPPLCPAGRQSTTHQQKGCHIWWLPSRLMV
jgi:hypothetical protein